MTNFKKNWIDASTLWLSVEWRFWLSLVLLTLIFWVFDLFGSQMSYEEQILSTRQADFSIGYAAYFYTPSIGVISFMFLALFYLIGASAKLAINHPFGKRLIKINHKDISLNRATWGNGFSLQWSLAWRTFVLYLIYSAILIILDIKEVVENIDGSVYTSYTIEEIRWLLPIVFGIISAKLLLFKSFGNIKYHIELKNRRAH